MSGDTPEIVLNEFGDLSRKARRELEARGIDPDTAVVEYIAATGQMPVITPEEAAAAKAQAQVEAEISRAEEVVSTPPVAHPIQSRPAEPIIPPVEKVDVQPQSSVPPISVPVTAAETGPIEPLVVSPALDSGSLTAVEETLATVSEHTGEVVTGFDSLLTTNTDNVASGPTKSQLRKLARKEKKAQSAAVKAEKLAAKEAAQREAEEAAATTAAALIALEQEEARVTEAHLAADRAEAERLEAERVAAENADAQRRAEEAAEAERRAEQARTDEKKREEQTETAAAAAAAAAVTFTEPAETASRVENLPIEELEDESVDADDDLEFELEPQTISEATAAIAIAEAVAAAEAVVEAGEVSVDNGNLASAVPATTGSISVIPNTLILPNLPETTGSIAPIVPTGEIVITGSILIPSSVSQTGALEAIDTSEVDIIAEEDQPAPTQGMAPVSAASAVSAYNISNTVVTTPRGMNERLPFILSVTAAGLAVGVVALFVAGYFLGLF
ncbi:hypothetical protein [Aurantimicrobium sp. MWH-Uga1]|uniref:hypothetical protein n=1 Tax=Aurantimicrobium sp. MWH-Uga1 TaxID=2079575 RepID=UPI000DED9B7D|nr:hypothetical protein [Aurantimicrobium sp. MWH-Uga1]AXE54440.1 hypothetical protein AURUGA1_00748 [Aurantimicrobium sp. MWH-Uga1]